MLGNPGSGCSTFLKAIANQRQEYHSVDGAVHYDSIEPNELRQHFRGDVQYCPEDDVHFATLSVAQTINFAARARTPRARVGETRKQFADKATDMLATLFGLRHALGTPVGDAAIRGVSGGEKKRVSITEALASRACIGTWDKCAIFVLIVVPCHVLTFPSQLNSWFRFEYRVGVCPCSPNRHRYVPADHRRHFVPGRRVAVHIFRQSLRHL